MKKFLSNSRITNHWFLEDGTVFWKAIRNDFLTLLFFALSIALGIPAE